MKTILSTLIFKAAAATIILTLSLQPIHADALDRANDYDENEDEGGGYIPWSPKPLPAKQLPQSQGVDPNTAKPTTGEENGSFFRKPGEYKPAHWQFADGTEGGAEGAGTAGNSSGQGQPQRNPFEDEPAGSQQHSYTPEGTTFAPGASISGGPGPYPRSNGGPPISLKDLPNPGNGGELTDPGSLNVQEFEEMLEYILNNPNHNWCLRYVSRLVRALTGNGLQGAAAFQSHPDRESNYTQVHPDTPPRDFDIRVMEAGPGAQWGHIEIYYQGHWYSDHIQDGSYWDMYPSIYGGVRTYRLNEGDFNATFTVPDDDNDSTDNS